MNTPRWLMGAALLFWGWESGLLIWGVLLAAALEGSRWTRLRWDLSSADLSRISDLGVALFAGATLWLYSTEDQTHFVFKLAQWLPLCFLPIMLAQAYGNREKMSLSVFWWLLRRSPETPLARKSYNISFCYFALCLLATSASTQPNVYFYPGITLLVALALTSARPRRVSWMAWLMLLALVANGGVLGHQQLKRVQDSMERALGGWLASLIGGSTDPRELPTRIGYPGALPQSGKIVLRVRPEPLGFTPGLLREATWDSYRAERWTSSNTDSLMAHAGSGPTVKLLPTNVLASAVEIASYYRNGEGLQALPHGTFEIDDLQDATVRTNRLGMVRIENAPGLMEIRALFGPDRSIDSPPCDRDLAVPKEEAPVMAQVLASLKLDRLTDRQKIRAIDRFFGEHFKYSLSPLQSRAPTWLGYFLTTSRTGHCQYFGTSTVLLLRQAGIPARYVTGYAVQENERHGDTYLVRGRDAHAWALVYHSDTKAWDNLDTTPGDRDKALGAQPPWWETASDALSNFYYQFSKWRWSKTSYARYSSWLLVPMILYLLARIMWNQRRQKRDPANDETLRAPWPGLDSELFLINRRLAAAQLARLPNEPLQSWQERLEQAFPDSERLRRIFRLHRSLRFDPRGLKTSDRDTLRQEAELWLADFTARQRHQPAP